MTGDMQLRVVNAVGKEATSYLHNVWIAYLRKDEDRRELLDRFRKVVPGIADDSPHLTKESIVAQVKDSEYLESFETCDFVAEHLCGDLWIVYAQDLPERMVSIKGSELPELGLAKADLFELATENLRRIMPSAECHGDGPWYVLSAGGDYTASLVLFDGVWEQLADSVEGEIVAVVPARDTLLFTGSESAEGLKAIREQAAHVVTTGNYVVSDTLIVRRGGRWEVFNAN